jgi:hypothetical protein
MDNLNIDILNEIFIHLNIKDMLSFATTNNKYFNIVKKTKIYYDYLIIKNQVLVTNYNFHYNLLKYCIDELIFEAKLYYDDNVFMFKTKRRDSVALSKILQTTLCYFVKILCTCQNTLMFGYLCDKIMPYTYLKIDDIVNIIRITVCKYSVDTRFLNIITSNNNHNKNFIGIPYSMIKHCKNYNVFKEFQTSPYRIDFTNPQIIYSLCRAKNMILLKYILETDISPIQMIIDNIITRNNRVKNGKTIFVSTLFEFINNNKELVHKFRKDLFFYACEYKNIDYIKNIFNDNLASNKKTIIRGLKNSMNTIYSFMPLFIFLEQYLNIEDVIKIFEYATYINKIKIMMFIKNKYNLELKRYYGSLTESSIIEKICGNRYFHKIFDLFEDAVIYPVYLKYRLDRINNKIFGTSSKTIIHKLLRQTNFTGENINDHLNILKLFMSYKNCYVLTKYKDYNGVTQTDKNNNLIELIVYLKLKNIENSLIVKVCKMIQ